MYSLRAVFCLAFCLTTFAANAQENQSTTAEVNPETVVATHSAVAPGPDVLPEPNLPTVTESLAGVATPPADDAIAFGGLMPLAPTTTDVTYLREPSATENHFAENMEANEITTTATVEVTTTATVEVTTTTTTEATTTATVEVHHDTPETKTTTTTAAGKNNSATPSTYNPLILSLACFGIALIW